MLISEVNIQNILHDFLVIWNCQEVHVTSWVFAYYSKLILKVCMMEKELKRFSVAHLGSFCMKRIRVLTPPSPLNMMLDHRTLHLNIRQFLVPSNTIGECHCEWKYPSQKNSLMTRWGLKPRPFESIALSLGHRVYHNKKGLTRYQ